ncbi:MAG: ABC transporter permease, partial [Rhizobacter sp.]|nr:ABC transporter permease [Rhizobacter sp.]
MIALLRQLSWPELRHHPWRNLAALLAVTLGVALAFSVQLINQSALSEFSAAVRSVNGQPDFEIRGQRGGFDEALYERVAGHPQVGWASPVIEIDTYAFDAQGRRIALRVLGIDALAVSPLSPALMPRLAEGADRLALLEPDALFLNVQAQEQLGATKTLRLQTPGGHGQWRVQGSVAASGPPLAVMDLAGAQHAFGWLGRLSRIDVRLAPGADRAAVLQSLALPAGLRAASPDEAAQRVSNVSRAYRVNLTVLALVALFTGAFLVFSILSLSVAKRQPQLALLGVLGLSARGRLALVLAESALLGIVGSALGLALGTALAALALRLLAGDLGGGYFPGVAPSLQFSAGAAWVYGLLGVMAALIGGWLPARAAQRLAPAQALKGLGDAASAPSAHWLGPVLLVAGVLLALLPPVAEIPLAAYLAVACLLFGGIACVPAGVGLLLRGLQPPRHALALLAVERARHQRHTATIAVAGVVASLSLAVALTVMVSSFRESMTQWLDSVLPA